MNELILKKMYSYAHDSNQLLSLTIELLTKCNEKCIHCYIPSHTSDGLSTGTVLDVIRQFRDLGGLNLTLTGGEIMLRNDLFEIIDYARSLCLRVFLLTNATLINKKHARLIRKHHVAEVSVSVYSLVSEEHDLITTVPGSLEKTLTGIKNLLNENIPVSISTPLMNVNKNSYKELCDYCLQNNISFKCSPVIFARSDGNKQPHNLNIPPNELKSLFDDIEKYIPGNNSTDVFNEACGKLRYLLAIDSSGYAYPCNSFYYTVGNVKKDTLSSIWDAPLLKKIQNINKTDLKECNRCRLLSKCNRCPGLAFLEDNDIYGCSSTARRIALCK